MEQKLTDIALNPLNHSKNHIGERKTEKGVQVGICYCKLVGN